MKKVLIEKVERQSRYKTSALRASLDLIACFMYVFSPALMR